MNLDQLGLKQGLTKKLQTAIIMANSIALFLV